MFLIGTSYVHIQEMFWIFIEPEIFYLNLQQVVDQVLTITCGCIKYKQFFVRTLRWEWKNTTVNLSIHRIFIFIEDKMSFPDFFLVKWSLISSFYCRTKCVVFRTTIKTSSLIQTQRIFCPLINQMHIARHHLISSLC